jgi:3'(2'), 5'-bisphosphate nucleotidase
MIQYIETLIDITQNLGGEMEKCYKKDIEELRLEDKNNSTPLTRTDKRAHDYLYSELSKLTPEIPILSEEGEVDWEVRKDWKEYWLVDPLDGTSGFINKTDDFCICISYIKDNSPILGLIYIPLTKTHYYATLNNGSYKLQDDKITKLSVKKPNDIKVVMGRNSYEKNTKKHLSKVIGNDYEVLLMGSAIKFCMLAEGSADYYPALGTCSEWDTAAGVCVLIEAGGFVQDCHGNSLQYNKKIDNISPPFFASAGIEIVRN